MPKYPGFIFYLLYVKLMMLMMNHGDPSGMSCLRLSLPPL